MKTGFLIFSVLCIAGIFASLARSGKLLDSSTIKNPVKNEILKK
jgi:hypothetical protein